jgi:CRP/FNR family cyclic AMP-dependent transcriptional regulator
MNRLTQVAFFKDVIVDLAPFESRVRWRYFSPNETLLDFDDASSDVYFLMTGEVRVLIRTRSGKEVILGELRNGAIFGELAALDGVKRSANVTALTRGEVCVMSAAVFHEIVFSSPQVAHKVFRLLTTRVRELDARLMEQTVLDLRHRLYAELLRLSVPRNGHEGERVVSPPPFHHVLASRIGCRREQVTREFTAMDADGLIERNRGALVLTKPEILQARVAAALRDE